MSKEHSKRLKVAPFLKKIQRAKSWVSCSHGRHLTTTRPGMASSLNFAARTPYDYGGA
jgi:hypothetical protein